VAGNPALRLRFVAAFMAFWSNTAYLAGIGHRTAAVEGSRPPPPVPTPTPSL